MIRFESRKLRRVIARLEPGEELVQSVAELARHERVRAGWLRAMGHLAWAELALHDPRRAERGRAQRFDGPFDLVSLDANVSVEENEVVVRAQGALARRTDNGVEVLGGAIVRAAVLHVELVLDCFEDLRLAREHDPALGLSVWRGVSERGPALHGEPREPVLDVPDPGGPERGEPDRGEPVTASAPRTVTWADVAALSAEPPSGERRISEPPTRLAPRVLGRPVERDTPELAAPARGDWIEHKQFGLCRVEKEDADGGLVIRPHSGPRKFIKLDVLEVLPPRLEDGKRIFPVRPRRK